MNVLVTDLLRHNRRRLGRGKLDSGAPARPARRLVVINLNINNVRNAKGRYQLPKLKVRRVLKPKLEGKDEKRVHVPTGCGQCTGQNSAPEDLMQSHATARGESPAPSATPRTRPQARPAAAEHTEAALAVRQAPVPAAQRPAEAAEARDPAHFRMCQTSARASPSRSRVP